MRPAERPVYIGGLMYTKRRAGRCNLIAPRARKHGTARKISHPYVDYVRQPFNLTTMRASPRYLALISLDPAKYAAMTNVG